MPFEIVRNDIAVMKAGVLVNAVSCMPSVGRGVDESLHTKAGPRLFAAREKLGYIPVGSAAVTPAFNLGQNM